VTAVSGLKTRKAAQQRICILLAKNGIAALSYDPIGQGERSQLLDANGKQRFKATSQHNLVGTGSVALGRGTATFRIWDLVLAVGLRGIAETPAIHAAAVESNLFASLTLSGDVPSWSEVVRDPTIGRMSDTVHGALAVYDLPDLVSLYRSLRNDPSSIKTRGSF
jgi:hypothetical protein